MFITPGKLEALSRDQKISALARRPGRNRECPCCGREVEVVDGYITQHTDPRTWGKGSKPKACGRELTLYRGSGFMASLTQDQISAALAYTGPDTHGPVQRFNRA